MKDVNGGSINVSDELLLSPAAISKEMDNIYAQMQMMHAYIEELRKVYLHLQQYRPEVLAEIGAGIAVAKKLMGE